MVTLEELLALGPFWDLPVRSLFFQRITSYGRNLSLVWAFDL